MRKKCSESELMALVFCEGNCDSWGFGVLRNSYFSKVLPEEKGASSSLLSWHGQLGSATAAVTDN